jgi:hypothetical protein
MNPGNRARLIGMDAAKFIETMSRWDRWFSEGADLPVISATEAELSSISVPVAIVAGDDDIHPLSAARELDRILPNSEFHDPPILRRSGTGYQAPAERDRVRAGPPAFRLSCNASQRDSQPVEHRGYATAAPVRAGALHQFSRPRRYAGLDGRTVRGRRPSAV